MKLIVEEDGKFTESELEGDGFTVENKSPKDFKFSAFSEGEYPHYNSGWVELEVKPGLVYKGYRDEYLLPGQEDSWVWNPEFSKWEKAEASVADPVGAIDEFGGGG